MPTYFLRGITREQVAELLRESRKPPSQETLARLREKLQAFEDSHGFGYETLLARLKSGEQEETEAVSRWLGEADLYRRLTSVDPNREDT